MNIYFLVEGSKTEMKVYPAWLNYLIPDFTELKQEPFVLNDNQDIDNTFYLFSGDGFPQILTHRLQSAVEDVNNINRINYLVIVLDSEEYTTKEKIEQVKDYINKKNIILNSAELIIIVQNSCIETWLLGNREIYQENSTNDRWINHTNHYNVKINDPELMLSGNPDENTAQYHCSYLEQMFLEKKIRYRKKKPKEVTTKTYLNELIKRQQETNHLQSFKSLLDFCNMINSKIK